MREDSRALNEAVSSKRLNEKKGSSQCVYFDRRERERRVRRGSRRGEDTERDRNGEMGGRQR